MTTTTSDNAVTRRNNAKKSIYRRPVPAAWLLAFGVVMALIIALSLYVSSGQAAVTNVLLGGMAWGGLWLLWLTPSGAGKLELTEIFLGVFILCVGIGIGSSGTANPYCARVWTAIGLNPMLVKPLAAPTEDMWNYQEGKLVPTSSVPRGQQLVVKPSHAPNGILVTETGFHVEGLHTLEVWLQDRNNGYTSSSIIIHLPPAVQPAASSSQSAPEGQPAPLDTAA